MYKSLRTLILAFSIPLSSFAAEPQEAEASALEFLQSIDGSISADTIYSSQMSSAFKAAIPQKNFNQNIGVLRIQLGGAATSRRLTGSQLINQIPGSPKPGIYYFIRYIGIYPTAKAAQDVTIEKEGDTWKVIGFMFTPVP